MRRLILSALLLATFALALALLTSQEASSSPSASPTTFGGVFVAGNGDNNPSAAAEEVTFNNSVDNVAAALVNAGWSATNQKTLKQKTKAEVTTEINKFKPGGVNELKAGDEFLFFFAGHGGDSFFPDTTEAGEGNGSDNHIRISAGVRIPDDELATMLSGFNKSVTINVILSCCKSNTFTDGANDLLSVTEKDGGNDVPAGDHVALTAAGDTTDFVDNDPVGMKFVKDLLKGLAKTGARLLYGDTNKDGTLTMKELADYVKALFTGPTQNKAACDEGGSCPPQGCGTEPTLVDDLTIVNKAAAPGLPDQGGIVRYPDVEQTAAGQSGSSSGIYAKLAGGLAAAFLALTAGAWYARRRFGQT